MGRVPLEFRGWDDQALRQPFNFTRECLCVLHNHSDDYLIGPGVAITLKRIDIRRCTDSRRDCKRKFHRTASCRLCVLLDTSNTYVRFFGGSIKAKPAITDLADTLQRRITLPAEDNRGMRFLHGLGVHAYFAEPTKLTRKLGLVLGPEQFHGFKVLARSIGTTFPGNADCGEFFGEPANANAKIESSFGEFIYAGNHLGEDHGIMFW